MDLSIQFTPQNTHSLLYHIQTFVLQKYKPHINIFLMRELLYYSVMHRNEYFSCISHEVEFISK